MDKRFIFTAIILCLLCAAVSAGVPGASFTSDVSTGKTPLEVTFTDSSRDETIADWAWDFGDNTETSKEQNPRHTYTLEGIYTVTLTVMNGEGVSYSSVKDYITVEKGVVVPTTIPTTVPTTIVPTVVPTIGIDTSKEVKLSNNVVTASKTTEVLLAAGDVRFKDTASNIQVTSSTLVNNAKFTPVASRESEKSLVWDSAASAEKAGVPELSIKYDYSGNTLKEQVTIQKDVNLKFPVSLSKDTKMIPWFNGDWKIVSSTSGDTMTGIVISKPFGIDAKGHRVEMDYTWDGVNLVLQYNRTIRLLNSTNAELHLKDEKYDPLKDPYLYEYTPISYPLVIDPTWTAMGSPTNRYESTDGAYTVVMFNITGSTTWTVPNTVTNVAYLVVAGGGAGPGGDSSSSGGGGAGEFLNGTGLAVSGIETIIVGAGGGNSSLTNDGATISAWRGGAGGYYGSGTKNGLPGGSGGGAGSGSDAGGGTGGTGIDGTNIGGSYLRGHNGGNSPSHAVNWGEGGGGGSGGVGVTGVINTAGDGGAGTSNDITGVATFYAAGGGGSVQGGTIGIGGSGIGGSGSKYLTTAATSGVAGTGSGGGGGGGAGGSGVVILRYTTPTTPIPNWTTESYTGSISNTTTIINTTLNFSAMNSTTSITSYNWSWGDSTWTNTTNANTTHEFTLVQNHTVGLYVTNTSGTSTVSTKYVNITRYFASTDGAYTVVKFNQTGYNTSWKTPAGVTNVTYLVVGGGGGGFQGGGGAGGYLAENTSVNSSVSITVGGGGSGYPSGPLNGGNSIFGSLIAYGGGAGGGWNGVGSNGASGGGGGATVTGDKAGGTATPSGQGNNGGNSRNGANYPGGGGGGSGAVGGYPASGNNGGNGGAGIDNTITGSTVGYAGGGGGMGESAGGTASHGGGYGSNGGTAASGTPGTGGGGGANKDAGVHGAGGSGVVIIRYLTYVAPAPVANFTASPTSGNAPLYVQFNDTSTGTPTAWNWSFGDGTFTNGTTQNVTHWYNTTGLYTVTLNASNAAGSNISTKTAYINATFDTQNYAYTIGHLINGSSSGALTNYPITMVLFNTSGTSLGENAFLGTGLTRPDWGDVRFTQNNVTDLPYWIETASLNGTSARFWVNMSSIASGTTTQTALFVYYGNSSKVNASNGTLTFPFFDDFNNGTTLDTTKWDTSGGGISVGSGAIQITGTTGNAIAKTGFGVGSAIRCYGSLSSGASDGPVIGTAESFTFSNYSILQFANNMYRCEETIATSLATSGSFGSLTGNRIWEIFRPNATLRDFVVSGTSRATNTRSKTVSEKILVRVDTTGTVIMNWVLVRPYAYTEPTHSTYSGGAVAPVANFTASPTSGNAPLYVQFNDTTTGTPTVWNWSFGDGSFTNGTTQNVTHWYNTTGLYTVTLNASNAGGSNISTKTAYINATFDTQNYAYTIGHMINGSSSGALTNYPITMVLFNTSGTSLGENAFLGSGKTRTDWGDVRFTQNNVTDLPYWIETASLNGTSARFWVNMSSIAGGVTTQTPLFVYYGNASKTNVSNGVRVFPFFDDFDGNSLNVTRWPKILGTPTVTNSNVTLTAVSETQWINTGNLFGVNVSTRFRASRTMAAGGTYHVSYMIYDMYDNSKSFGILNHRNIFITTYGGLCRDGFTGNVEFSSPQIDTNIHIWELIRTGTNVIAVVDGTTKATKSETRTDTMGFTFITESGQSAIVVMDWVLVRPYASSEPTHSTYSGGESVSAPVASFTSNVTKGNVSFVVQFNDTSSGTPTSWSWTFGDGKASTTQNATNTYNAVIGNTITTYTVNFSATNAGGTNWSNRSAYITAYPLNASFTANSTSGNLPKVIQFNDTSDNGTATNWNWSFGDGTYSNSQNVTKTYNMVGNYTVTLNASNAYSWDIETKTNYINISSSLPINVSYTTAGTYYWVVPIGVTSVSLDLYSGGGGGGGGGASANQFPWSGGVGGDGGLSGSGAVSNLNVTPGTNITIVVGAGGSSGAAGTYHTHTNERGVVTYDTVVGGTGGAGGTSSFWTTSFTGGSGGVGGDQNMVEYNGAASAGGNGANGNLNASVYGSNGATGSTGSSTPNSAGAAGGNGGTGYGSGGGGGGGGGRINAYGGASGQGAPGYVSFTYTVSTIPSAIYTSNVSSGFPPFGVQFTDWSTNNPTAWSWIFGDGKTSTVQNASTTYNAVIGNTVTSYNVNLYAYNAGGSYWENRTGYITSYPLNASFSANSTTGGSPKAVQFTDLTNNGTASAWAWNFGDGQTSTSQNPIHTYSGIGNYTVSLNASNGYAWDNESKTNYISIIPEPTANFTSNVTSGYPNFDVQFNDTSLNTSTSWNWTFGDGFYSDEQDPVNNYSSVIGNTITTYTVILNATNAAGSNTSTKTSYITAYPLNASFSANVTTGNAPVAILFTDASDNGTATNWNWSFGDGTYSDSQSPTKTYSSTGIYNVTLNVSNAYSWDLETKTNYITTVTTPVASFTSNVTTGNVSFDVQFNDTSSNTPTAWYWDFNDGHTSTTQNATNTYNAVIGNTITTYTVNFSATNAGGTNWSNRSAYMTAYPLNASFSANATTGNFPLAILFTDLTNNGTASAWNWSFGDGTYSNSQSPVKTYSAAGTYTVVLNASNAYSWDLETRTGYITVGTPAYPVANFTSNVTVSYEGYPVQFTSTSVTGITAYNWSFGNATANPGSYSFSEQQDPLWTCPETGYYTVSLNVTNASGYNTTTKYNYIDVQERVDNQFEFSFTPASQAIQNGTTYLLTSNIAKLNANASLLEVKVEWDPNILNISNFRGNTSYYSTTSVSFTPYEDEDFRYDPANGSAYFSVSRSSGGFIATSSTERPVVDMDVQYVNYTAGATTQVLHTYGEYYEAPYYLPWYVDIYKNVTYSLNAWNFTANFTANATTTVPNQVLMFNSSFTGSYPNRWNWSWGDGTFTDGTAGNTTHSWSTSGLKTVSVREYLWQNTSVNNTSVRTDYITVGAIPVANFTASPTSGNAPLSVQFNDTSTNTPTAWNWSFGDGTYSATQNATKQYTVTGLYTVVLNASNAGGSNLSTKTAYINATFDTQNYAYTIGHLINGSSSGALTNYPITMVLFNTSGTSLGENAFLGSGKTRTDWGDVRFTQNNVTDLPYWIETASLNGTSARFWVNMSSIASGTTTQTALFVYYGNSSKVNASNGTLVFPFFDDFNNGTTLDTGKWTKSESNGAVTIGSSVCSITSTGIGYSGITSSYNTTSGMVIRSYLKSGHLAGSTSYFEYFGASDAARAIFQRVGYANDNSLGNGQFINQNSDSSASNIVGVTANVYHTLDLIRSTSSAIYKINGGNAVEISSYYNTVSLPIMVNTYYTGSAVYTDWVLVRPYASSEPTHSTYSGGESVSAPVASFTSNVTKGNVSFVVQFNDTSSGTPTSWSWTFGDGKASTTQNATNTYSAVIGNTITTYTINFSATNAGGTSWSNQSAYITAYPLNASFTANATSGIAPTAILFTDSTDNGTATNWNWSFGDGTYSNSQSPTKTYSTAGTYTVILNSSNAYSYDLETKTNYITISTAAPVASFTSNVTNGTAPLAVQFNDTTTGTPTVWNWSFTNITPGNNTETYFSTVQNASTTFGVGNFSISLNASNAGGYNISTGVVFINVSAIPVYPVSNWSSESYTGSISNTTPIINTTLNFTGVNSTTDITTWNWSFGDGTYASTMNVSHEFTLVQNHTVNLTVTNASGSNSLVKYVNITRYFASTDEAYTVVKYNQTGYSTTWKTPVNVTSVQYLVVAGGGGGGSFSGYAGGGGGGGGVLQNTSGYTTIENASYPIVVGSGGSNISYGSFGYSGSNSSFGIIIAVGGGGGGRATGSEYSGKNGGSGGGAGGDSTRPVTNHGNGITGQGYNGGNGTPSGPPVSIRVGGGGGGAGGLGIDATSLSAGNGGVGISSSITGSTVYYSGGGGGGSGTDSGTPLTYGSGGNGGGGNGGYGKTTAAINGTNGLGGGGGGASYGIDAGLSSGSGGSGVVIIRYLTDNTPAPVASFTSNATSGYPAFVVQFNDTSSNVPTSWYYNFGDGHTSTTQNATNTYNAVIGNTITTYTVNFSATNAGGTNWSNRSAYMTAYPLNASFSANATTGNFPLAILFTDLTNNGTASAWNWSFGDGTFSNSQSPVKTYSAAGTYTVVLNASNAYSWDNETKTGYITVGTTAPVANFTSNVTSGTGPLAVQFNDTSLNNPTSWNWSFTNVTGNNTATYFSTVQNASQTFGVGNFSISLNASNAGGYNISTTVRFINVSLLVVPPVTNFTSNVTRGNASFTAQFNDTSSNTPTAWYWSFGDGKTSTTQNATNTYNAVIGNTVTTYNVSLNASNAGGSDWENKTSYITAYPLNASFSANVTSGNLPVAILFTGSATNGTATNWNWSFGDGSYSDSQSPTKTYNTVGTYTVVLNASNAYSYDLETKTSYISISSSLPINVSYTTPGTYYWIVPVGVTSVSLDLYSAGGGGGGGGASGDYSGGVGGTGGSAGSGAASTLNVTPGTNITIIVGAGGSNGAAGTYHTHTNERAYVTYHTVAGSSGSTGGTSSFSTTSYAGGAGGAGGDQNPTYDQPASAGSSGSNGNMNASVSGSNGASGAHGGVNPSIGLGGNEDGASGGNGGTGYGSGGGGGGGAGRFVAYGGAGGSGSNGYVIFNYTVSTIPSAAFTSNVTVVYPSSAVQFTDWSTNSPTAWSWIFGDGKTSTTQNATNTYNSVIGNTVTSYNVNLYAYNAGGSYWENRTGYIIAYPLNASFTANSTSGSSPKTVQFNDVTDNGTATSWLWNFGDSQTSISQNPVHTYSGSGNYTVTLNASNGYSYDIESQTNYISLVSAPVSNFTSNVTQGYPDFDVQFNDTSSNNPTAWNWSFGDGTYSDEQDPVNAYYNVIGNTVTTYNVSLNAGNAGGSDWENKTSYITAYPLNASFSANSTSGTSPKAVLFTGSANNGTASSWNWSFGDGSYSDSQSPTHTYSSDGVYNVVLNVSNAYSYDLETKTNYITVSLAPEASFISNVTSGYLALDVQFNDTSLNIPSSWNWSFGDGTYSTVRNATHTYNNSVIGNAPAQFTVVLNASNGAGSGIATMTNYITVYPLNTSFSANVTSSAAPGTILFTGSATNGTPTSWYWTFGDGYTSLSQNPVHTYSSVGTYTVTLNASNLYSFDVESKTGYITISPAGVAPVASFISNVTSGFPAVPVQFNDTSSNSPTAWYWDFGDGRTSSARNATNTYNAVIGNTVTTYNVSLNVGNSIGSDWENKTSYITLYPLNALFSTNSSSGNFPKAVQFTGAATNGTATNWNWSFGDGTFSNSQNPVKTYSAAGTYTVVLNASNAYSYDLETKANYITIGTTVPVAAFTSNVTTGYPSFDVRFTDTTSNTPTSWLWLFGDGQTSIDQNPVHTYNQTIGNVVTTYTVSMKAINSGGSSWSNRTAYITSLPINAAFTTGAVGGSYPTTIQFTDTSTNGVPTFWYWDFGDGAYSSSQSPSHTYTTAGLFTVRFQAGNAYTSDWENKTSLISITNPTSIASFTTSTSWGAAPLSVTFTDTTTPAATSWTWDFGDGGSSNLQNPTHTYATAGTYTVIFHAVNSYGGGSASTVITATATPTTVPTTHVPGTVEPVLEAKFSGAPLMGNPPHWVQFTDKSYGMPHTTEYDFGDGTPVSNETNPAHQYTFSGKFDVKLTVRGTGAYSAMVSEVTYARMINVLGAVTPVPTTTYGEKAIDMTNAYANITMYGEILPTVYADSMGSAGLYLFFGLFLGFIFMAMFARMGDTTMVSLYGITVGGIVTTTGMLTSFIPVEFQRISQGFLILCIAGLLYSLWRGR